MDLTGRVGIVTGAARIGQARVRRLVRDGAAVIATDVTDGFFTYHSTVAASGFGDFLPVIGLEGAQRARELGYKTQRTRVGDPGIWSTKTACRSIRASGMPARI
jgi:hypothetical protein